MKTKNFSRADFVSALCGAEAWAISPSWADTLRGWATMENFNPAAIVTQAGERYGSGMSRTSVRDGVGIMQVRGPLFTHENFLTWLFGFDTYESLAQDFTTMMNDGNVRGVVLNFHSPGGLVAGGSDLAQMIHDARGLKPQGLVARAGGDMASMAYWLGSSAERIFTAPTGMVGSIGTLVQFSQDEPGLVTVVSDQSPNKRPDLSSPEGMAQIKATLNALSDVFIGAVARNRGVAPDHVVENFGKGGVKVGAEAVAAGMADQVSTFDATFSHVKNSTQSFTQENTMSVNQNQPGAAAATPAPAAAAETPVAPVAPAAPIAAAPSVDLVAQERARISGIMGAFAGTSFSDEALGFIDSGKSVAEAQAHVLGKLKAPAPAAAAPAVTQAALAQEGRMATAAAQAPAPAAPQGGDHEAAGVMAAMTAGANGYRARISGGNPSKDFSAPTTPAGR